MILIVDNYTCPADKILKRFNLNKNPTIELIESELPNFCSLESISNYKHTVFVIHEEVVKDLKYISHYFDEVYQIKEFNYLMYYNRKKSIARTYDITKNFKEFLKNEIFSIKKNTDLSKEKLDSLPFLDVQKNQSVEFPEEDEEEI